MCLTRAPVLAIAANRNGAGRSFALTRATTAAAAYRAKQHSAPRRPQCQCQAKRRSCWCLA